MRHCHVCGQSWTSHAADCRVHADIARMRRTYERMVAEGRDDPLRQRIRDYLDLFGALPCQGRDERPTARDCRTCGHGDICVIAQAA